MSLDKEIRNHYARQEPSDDFWLRLEEELGESKPEERRVIWWPRYVAAAALAILAFLGFQLVEDEGLSVEIFEEVATHHLNEKPMDVLTADYATLNRSLDKLGDDLEPTLGLMDRFQLEGGRYCSIHHRLALQLKLRDRETLHTGTLYVTNLHQEFLNTPAYAEQSLGDVDLRMWHEKGRLYVLATASHPGSDSP